MRQQRERIYYLSHPLEKGYVDDYELKCGFVIRVIAPKPIRFTMNQTSVLPVLMLRTRGLKAAQIIRTETHMYRAKTN
jgi:hypothetical protein